MKMKITLANRHHPQGVGGGEAASWWPSGKTPGTAQKIKSRLGGFSCRTI